MITAIYYEKACLVLIKLETWIVMSVTKSFGNRLLLRIAV